MGLLLVGTAPTAAADFETATNAVKNMGLGWNLGNTLDANSQSVTDVTSAAYWDSRTCHRRRAGGSLSPSPS